MKAVYQILALVSCVSVIGCDVVIQPTVNNPTVTVVNPSPIPSGGQTTSVGTSVLMPNPACTVSPSPTPSPPPPSPKWIYSTRGQWTLNGQTYSDGNGRPTNYISDSTSYVYQDFTLDKDTEISKIFIGDAWFLTFANSHSNLPQHYAAELVTILDSNERIILTQNAFPPDPPSVLQLSDGNAFGVELDIAPLELRGGETYRIQVKYDDPDQPYTLYAPHVFWNLSGLFALFGLDT